MKKQRGLTLIEILVALALGVFILATLLTLFVNLVKNSSDTIKATRLNHDLDLAMRLMVEDIRRAGYSGAMTALNPDAFSNAFTSAANTVQIGNSVGTNDCILYTYDENYNGSVDNISGGVREYYGFRLYQNPDTNTRTIQLRLSNVNCGATGASWQSITDENTLDVVDLKFSFSAMPAQAATSTLPAYPALTATSRCYNYDNSNTATNTTSTVTNAGVCNFATPPATDNRIGQKRIVNIRITARLVNDPDVVKSLSSSVKVTNDRLYKQP